MMTSAGSNAVRGHKIYRTGRAGRMMAVCGLVALLFGFGPAAMAQEAPAAEDKETATVPRELEGIPGVRAGMSDQELIDLAETLSLDGRNASASNILVYIVRRDKENLDAFSLLGRVYERMTQDEREKGTEQSSRQADTYENWAVGAYLEAARLAMDTQEYGRAEDLYNRVFLIDPSNMRCRLGLARVFSETERPLQAEQHYKEYLKSPTGRNDADAYVELADIYKQLKSPYQRLAILVEAEELDPNNVDILMALAEAYYQRAKLSEAMRVAQRAVDRAPGNHRAHYTLSGLYLGQKAYDKSETAIRKAIELCRNDLARNPSDAELLGDLSEYYGGYRTLLNNMITDDQDNIVLRTRLARVIMEKAEVDQTQMCLRAITILTKIEPKPDAAYLATLAELQFKTHQLDKAAQTCEKLLKIDTQNPDAKRLQRRIAAEQKGDQPSDPTP